MCVGGGYSLNFPQKVQSVLIARMDTWALHNYQKYQNSLCQFLALSFKSALYSFFPNHSLTIFPKQ